MREESGAERHNSPEVISAEGRVADTKKSDESGGMATTEVSTAAAGASACTMDG